MIFDYYNHFSNIESFILNINSANPPLEKDKYGEVNTPTPIIYELLDNLPAHVWSNPQLKWLDPAAGSGNFPIIIFSKLYNSLANIIPDAQERQNHIIQNMLYMIEINHENTKILKKIFGENANIQTADFLGIPSYPHKFDIIIGNPPYQTTKTDTYLGSAGSGKTLWDKFIVKSFDIINPNGFLVFITPANWRRPESKLYDLMTKINHLQYLHIYSKSDGQQIFGVQTRFDVYIIQHGSNHNNNNLGKIINKLIDEKGTSYQDFDISMWPFLPNYNYSNIKNLLVSDKNQGINIQFDSSKYDARKLSKDKIEPFIYPIVHTITKKGLGIRYSQEPPIFQPKVLLNFNEQQYPYNDYLGEYGMSQLTFGIPVLNQFEGERVIEKINSPEFREIIRATKWSAFQTDYRMFKYFRTDFYI